jgi:hypothetical protein
MTRAQLHRLTTVLQQAASAATALANGMRHDGVTLDHAPAVLTLGAALRELDAVRETLGQPAPQSSANATHG